MCGAGWGGRGAPTLVWAGQLLPRLRDGMATAASAVGRGVGVPGMGALRHGGPGRGGSVLLRGGSSSPTPAQGCPGPQCGRPQPGTVGAGSASVQRPWERGGQQRGDGGRGWEPPVGTGGAAGRCWCWRSAAAPGSVGAPWRAQQGSRSPGARRGHRSGSDPTGSRAQPDAPGVRPGRAAVPGPAGVKPGQKPSPGREGNSGSAPQDASTGASWLRGPAAPELPGREQARKVPRAAAQAVPGREGRGCRCFRAPAASCKHFPGWEGTGGTCCPPQCFPSLQSWRNLASVPAPAAHGQAASGLDLAVPCRHEPSGTRLPRGHRRGGPGGAHPGLRVHTGTPAGSRHWGWAHPRGWGRGVGAPQVWGYPRVCGGCRVCVCWDTRVPACLRGLQSACPRAHAGTRVCLRA